MTKLQGVVHAVPHLPAFPILVPLLGSFKPRAFLIYIHSKFVLVETVLELQPPC